MKIDKLCLKYDARISEDEFRRILRGDIEWMKDNDSQLVKELYAKMRYQSLRPRVRVSYLREPYIYKAGNVRVGVILIVFARRKYEKTPYILIVNCDDDNAEKSAAELIGKAVEKSVIKSKTVNAAGIEMTMEIRVKDSDTSFVNQINALDGVIGATLVTFNGEYMS